MSTPNDRVVFRRALTQSASAIALGAAALALTPVAAWAQAANPPSAGATGTVQELVVTGVRQALATSQEIKRNADTIVDSITATDIGAFPDKSVAEALQRVPGITVNRFAASDDTSHFSAEPSGVLVRGLPQVLTQFNGRDTFSANSSRGLGWGDVSPELMAGVDVYKNQTADLIEGGIAGTVNLRTRVPFDQTGRVLALSINGNYGDLSKKWTPDVSGLVADRWQTSIGEFGLLANLAYSDVQTRSQGVQYGQMGVFKDLYGPGLKYIPASIANRDVDYERVRKGASLAGQWQDNDHHFLLTAQYNRSEFEDTWKERGVVSYINDPFGNPVDTVYSNAFKPEQAPVPAPGSSFTFDDAGNFRSGVLTTLQCCTGPNATGNSWWGIPPGNDTNQGDAGNIALNSNGRNMLNPCYSWQGTACAFPGRGNDLNAVSRYNNTKDMTEDASINLKWDPNDQWKFNFDVQRVHSTVQNYDVEVGQYSFANLQLDATGSQPVMTLLPPSNINQSPGGLANPDNYRYNHVMDHMESDSGTETAVRLDGQYRFQSEWLDSLRFGVRYADRDQRVRYSAFNWGNIANDWNLNNNQYVFWNIDKTTPNGTFKGYPTGLYDVVPFGNSFFGGPTQSLVFFNMDALAAHKADLLSYANLGVGQDQWSPLCQRTGLTDGCFRDSEIDHVNEKAKAAFVELKFGGRDSRIGGFRVSGNIGVRYVQTDDTSSGSVVAPRPFSSTTLDCHTLTPPPAGAPPLAIPKSIGCYLAAEVPFNSGAGTSSTVKTPHKNWLPSFNLTVDLTDDWLLRFAASRSMSRPDIGLLKNYTSIQAVLPGSQAISDPRWIKDAAGNPIAVVPTYTANAYNPSLAPTTADGFDLSLEHYFGKVGSFSVDVFYKKFYNYIQYGTFDRQVTVGGVTRTVSVTGPQNGQGASLQGFEVAYQRFFDFLPGPWDGLGMQANYTFVDNRGISNSNLKVASGGESAQTAQGGTSNTSLPVNSLEGLSRHAFNVVGMYEKGPWAVRAAYNWRSKWLVTSVDCCIYLPMWEDAAGFLDGSVRYRVNDNVELSVQGSNLLNTKTVILQQVNAAGLLKPGSWFQNDRRIVFGLRLKY
ncbi:MAG: TonB-dependent receptor [Phenylobacterium sp.]|nr:TonB-dependent receptor [Phenylobacterium sp.]